jgi:hypothetical protein
VLASFCLGKCRVGQPTGARWSLADSSAFIHYIPLSPPASQSLALFQDFSLYLAIEFCAGCDVKDAVFVILTTFANPI